MMTGKNDELSRNTEESSENIGESSENIGEVHQEHGKYALNDATSGTIDTGSDKTPAKPPMVKTQVLSLSKIETDTIDRITSDTGEKQIKSNFKDVEIDFSNLLNYSFK